MKRKAICDILYDGATGDAAALCGQPRRIDSHG
jgi:hypothetical protein